MADQKVGHAHDFHVRLHARVAGFGG
jgi:hypothetical protein